MKPKITDDAPCIGLPGMAYQVHLDEPIGTRNLVDGQCHDGSVAAGTSHCEEHGLRMTWHDGQPEIHPPY
jgi:hypothetical protein